MKQDENVQKLLADGKILERPPSETMRLYKVPYEDVVKARSLAKKACIENEGINAYIQSRHKRYVRNIQVRLIKLERKYRGILRAIEDANPVKGKRSNSLVAISRQYNLSKQRITQIRSEMIKCATDMQIELGVLVKGLLSEI